jgi:hypothetical protein
MMITASLARKRSTAPCVPVDSVSDTGGGLVGASLFAGQPNSPMRFRPLPAPDTGQPAKRASEFHKPAAGFCQREHFAKSTSHLDEAAEWRRAT